MNSRLLISLLILQIGSVIHAFDSGFEPVENPGLYKLRNRTEDLENKLRWRKMYGEELDPQALAYMKTPEGKMKWYGLDQKWANEVSTAIPAETTSEWFTRMFGRKTETSRQLERNWNINNAKRFSEERLARYENERQKLEKSIATLSSDIINMEDQLADMKAQIRGIPVTHYRYRGTRAPFVQRVKNWFGSWYK